jgi:hypothetical protein
MQTVTYIPKKQLRGTYKLYKITMIDGKAVKKQLVKRDLSKDEVEHLLFLIEKKIIRKI